MTRHEVRPFRWFGHGIDIRVVEGDDGLLFFAQDICEALELTIERAYDQVAHQYRDIYPPASEVLPDVVDDNYDPIPLYDLARVRDLAIDTQDDEFMLFMSGLLGSVDGSVTLPIEPVATIARGTFDVASAARMLSRDPAITIGRDALFQLMRRDLGWIEREVDTWIPTDHPRAAGYLIRYRSNNRPGAARQVYAGVRITTAGLIHLHMRLGGVVSIQFDTPAQPALLEI